MISKKAFTLIELLVAMTIFTIIVAVSSGMFVSAIKAQRKTLAEQGLLNQASYALEFMSRSLRMASKELNAFPACLDQYGLNYEKHNEGGIDRLRFINSLQGNDCQEFFLDGNQLKYRTGIDGASEVILELTSPDLEVSIFESTLNGEPQADDLQPRVNIILEIKKAGTEYPPLIIQTTISQRNLDITY